jgi:hypothetical protein
MHVLRLACERPDDVGRAVSVWTCEQLVRQLEDEGVVEEISAATVRRWLLSAKLKPWRVHSWMNPTSPRDEVFFGRVRVLADLYTRPLASHEMVLCVDEKTSLQPRPRLAPTKPARPGRTVQVEHEYKRWGAVHLFAAFDTRTGHVWGRCFSRKRQHEMITFLTDLDRQLPAAKTKVFLVMDNVSYHKGKEVRAWLAKHPRYEVVFTPVHCSWLNQVEQWFGRLQRERLKVSDFTSLTDMAQKIRRYIEQSNRHARPFAWSKASFRKVLPEWAGEVAEPPCQAVASLATAA